MSTTTSIVDEIYEREANDQGFGDLLDDLIEAVRAEERERAMCIVMPTPKESGPMTDEHFSDLNRRVHQIEGDMEIHFLGGKVWKERMKCN